MNATQLIDWATKAGLAGLLLAVLYLGYTGTWVWGSQLKDEQSRTAQAVADRDRWQKLALQGTKLAEELSNTGSVLRTSPIPSTGLSADEVAKKLNEVKLKAFPGME